ncbi:hypothetical protein N656DRAFT_716319 [Canariomyces notabilis]|uniref:Acyl-coenzyme A diphosphatase SCS3 n=1 Tax=Canariomyces notabilis TaxID=2074819 RepID=A0AAN6QM59_9PEZI|nr:hypothetical protein N656DRAFT_716319 [Canariomyces arenarius]
MNSPNPSRRYKTPSELASSPSRIARITATTTTTTHPSATPSSLSPSSTRNSPYLPTPTEQALLAAYPAVLIFGTIFALLSPETRASSFSAAQRAQAQTWQARENAPPSYFARKGNLFNILFVKRGWAWVTVAFFAFLLTHPALANQTRRVRAAIRWGMVTAWWVFVTQWFFGPPIIDRGFRFTGGKCEVAIAKVEEQAGINTNGGAAWGGNKKDGQVGAGEVLTAAACRASGGAWSGGHDISGHVFLLVLGSFFLLQEVGWVVARWGRCWAEERSVVMHDSAVKGAGVEAEGSDGREGNAPANSVLEALGYGGRLAAAVVGLSGWMLLMTAIYFHTWFEKLTGLLVALTGLYITYILPRWVPALRGIIGLPGV